MRRHYVVGAAIVLLALAACGMPAAAADQLEVALVSFTSPVTTNSQVTLTIRTESGAECKGSIRYRERTQGLVPKTAGEQGTVTWSWRLGKDVRGNIPIDVQCAKGDKRGSLSVTLVVD
jgi:hypothetical protein